VFTKISFYEQYSTALHVSFNTLGHVNYILLTLVTPWTFFRLRVYKSRLHAVEDMRQRLKRNVVMENEITLLSMVFALCTELQILKIFSPKRNTYK
jgi:hypothetical protein